MELFVFIVSAIVALLGAVAMLLSKNAIHSALFLLLNMGAIAVLYLLLRAPFLFAVQLIIYAGAIIVLFLFVVMLLGAERAEDERDQIPWQRPLALVMGLLLLGEEDIDRLAGPDRRGFVQQLPAALRADLGDPSGGDRRRGGAEQAGAAG